MTGKHDYEATDLEKVTDYSEEKEISTQNIEELILFWLFLRNSTSNEIKFNFDLFAGNVLD